VVSLDHIEKTIEIKAPPEEVWALLSDLERIPEWAKGYAEREVITSKQRTGVGTTTHEVGVAFGKPYEKDFIVTEWVEREKISFSSTSGWPWKGSWIMKPIKEGTLFTYVVDFELPYGVEKLKASFREKYEKLIEEWMQNIKKIVEKKRH
jgi:uncharacterized protein YndB with AHSA1/START domain